MRSPPLALAVILLLLALVAATALAFIRVQRLAALLLAPYSAWTGYMAYLTAGFWWLNQS